MWDIEEVENYSELIDPNDYHKIMRKHLYISETDEKICQMISEKVKTSKEKLNVCEIGGGTGALTELIVKIENINLLIIEIDENFYNFLKKKFAKYDNVTIVNADISQYRFDTKIDIFYSMGVHHHIPKGEKTIEYLRTIKANLSNDGFYLLGDEFIPPYKNDKERTLNLIIWFSHIIENARVQGHDILAIEEARTLYYDILGIEDYKNSLDELDRELDIADMKRFKTVRLGPKEDIGGLYICQIC